MKYNSNYHYPYEDLCNTGHQTIYTKDLNQDNIIIDEKTALFDTVDKKFRKLRRDNHEKLYS